MNTMIKCGECSRVFDLFNGTDYEELVVGHDCEASND
jgi:hypothetical protein